MTRHPKQQALPTALPRETLYLRHKPELAAGIAVGLDARTAWRRAAARMAAGPISDAGRMALNGVSASSPSAARRLSSTARARTAPPRGGSGDSPRLGIASAR